MCRVMILKGIEDSTLAMQFMQAVAPEMSQGNRDGIGYSAINSKNKLFMEKWHTNDMFLNTKDVVDKATLKALEPYKNRLPNIKLNYMKYGQVTRDDLRTVTMHTRFATCGKEMANVHPFVDQETSLVHNGVITNATELNLNKISTCDSEVALQLYINNKMANQLEVPAFQDYIDQLRGGFAFGILAKGSDGIYHVDIVRERSSLHFATLPELGAECCVFATTQSIIEEGVKALGLPKREKIFSLTEGSYHRFNALNGEFIDMYKLTESKLNIVPKVEYVYDETHWNTWRQGRQRRASNNLHIIDDGDYPVGHNNPTNYTKPKEEVVRPNYEDMYEGFQEKKTETSVSKQLKNQIQGLLDDAASIDSFYDTEILLSERLYSYDELMGTNLLIVYNDLPARIKYFIETKEEADYIDFNIIQEMLEEYEKSFSIESIYTVFKNKKRA